MTRFGWVWVAIAVGAAVIVAGRRVADARRLAQAWAEQTDDLAGVR